MEIQETTKNQHLLTNTYSCSLIHDNCFNIRNLYSDNFNMLTTNVDSCCFSHKTACNTKHPIILLEPSFSCCYNPDCEHLSKLNRLPSLSTMPHQMSTNTLTITPFREVNTITSSVMNGHLLSCSQLFDELNEHGCAKKSLHNCSSESCLNPKPIPIATSSDSSNNEEIVVPLKKNNTSYSNLSSTLNDCGSTNDHSNDSSIDCSFKASSEEDQQQPKKVKGRVVKKKKATIKPKDNEEDSTSSNSLPKPSYSKEKVGKLRLKSCSKNCTKNKHGMNKGWWTQEEHELFLKGLEVCGNNWKDIAEKFVKTRGRTQVASHAQKWKQSLGLIP